VSTCMFDIVTMRRGVEEGWEGAVEVGEEIINPSESRDARWRSKNARRRVGRYKKYEIPKKKNTHGGIRTHAF
jgi:hypothetical protein